MKTTKQWKKKKTNRKNFDLLLTNMADRQKTCIVISGPTAVGKTGLSLELAGFFNAPILSYDSRQCYRELDIGVAKPTHAELQQAPHYFIDTHSVFDEVNAAEFARYADRTVAELFIDNDVLIMVGGTGLYLKAFLEGLDEMPEIDPEIRSQLRLDYEMFGLEWLRSELINADPLYTQLSNPQRMLRALEVIRSTGVSVTAWQRSVRKSHDFHVVKIGLELDRDQLYNRINFRVDEMIKKGLFNEVESLLRFKNYNALNTVGYKELFEVIAGNYSLEKGILDIKQHTRNYAKRQLTWFRRDSEYTWFIPTAIEKIKSYCLESLAK
jgi:tRNA dimethylallyltransferase